MLVGIIIVVVIGGMFISLIADLIWKIRLIGYAIRRRL